MTKDVDYFLNCFSNRLFVSNLWEFCLVFFFFLWGDCFLDIQFAYIVFTLIFYQMCN